MKTHFSPEDKIGRFLETKEMVPCVYVTELSDFFPATQGNRVEVRPLCQGFYLAPFIPTVMMRDVELSYTEQGPVTLSYPLPQKELGCCFGWGWRLKCVPFCRRP